MISLSHRWFYHPTTSSWATHAWCQTPLSALFMQVNVHSPFRAPNYHDTIMNDITVIRQQNQHHTIVVQGPGRGSYTTGSAAITVPLLSRTHHRRLGRTTYVEIRANRLLAVVPALSNIEP